MVGACWARVPSVWVLMESVERAWIQVPPMLHCSIHVTLDQWYHLPVPQFLSLSKRSIILISPLLG